ncbi:MAG: hypothetical protein MUR28_03085 [Candidatus Thioglobus sp.]|nr:hypothetical protein [Gammaproteobacteria bacterium]MDP0560101.1 hypothetical protein [Candidatus Thioglobus sp.]
MPTSIIVGSTGLVGGNVIKVLSNKKQRAVALTRRSIPNLPPNITEMIIDFDAFEKNGSLPSCNNVFICLGTTIKTAGSKENFRKVDIDYCLSIARKAKESGAETLSLISSIGANSSSKNFYLKTKGELEESIQRIGFSTVNIFRPSFLVGERSEKRLAEKIAINLAKIMDLFLIGTASKYRSVKAESLAKTMVLKADNKSGVNYFYFDDFLR